MRSLVVVLACAACGRVRFETAPDAIAGDDGGADAAAGTIAFVGTASVPPFAPGAPVQVMAPPGVVAGDLMLLALYANQDTAVVSPPAGWTMMFDQVDATAMFRASYFDHRVAGGEATSYGFVVSGSNSVAWGVVAYRGVAPLTPYDGDTATLSTGTLQGNTATYIAPSITTTAAGDLLVLLAVNDCGFDPATGAWSTPGMVTRAGHIRAALFDEPWLAPGATGDRIPAETISAATPGPRGAVRLVALRPE